MEADLRKFQAYIWRKVSQEQNMWTTLVSEAKLYVMVPINPQVDLQKK